jgi:hypothetical protein
VLLHFISLIAEVGILASNIIIIIRESSEEEDLRERPPVKFILLTCLSFVTTLVSTAVSVIGTQEVIKYMGRLSKVATSAAASISSGGKRGCQQGSDCNVDCALVATADARAQSSTLPRGNEGCERTSIGEEQKGGGERNEGVCPGIRSSGREDIDKSVNCSHGQCTEDCQTRCNSKPKDGPGHIADTSWCNGDDIEGAGLRILENECVKLRLSRSSVASSAESDGVVNGNQKTYI